MKTLKLFDDRVNSDHQLLNKPSKNIHFNREYKNQQNQIEELTDRASFLTSAFKIIESRNREIYDSLIYASRIQQALLPSTNNIGEIFKNHVLCYMPKDVVSGDFYWVSSQNDYSVIVTGDCTGHGVPGAFMSFVGFMLLNTIVNEQHFTNPSYILHLLHKQMINFFNMHHNEDGEIQDGIELSICSIHLKTKKLIYAGANRPLVYIHNNELNIIQGDKFGVGGLLSGSKHKFFTTHKLSLEQGDNLYMFTDGITDQFGGQHDKKFGKKRLFNLLSEINHLEGNTKSEIIINRFLDWKGKKDQVDDALLFGMTVE